MLTPATRMIVYGICGVAAMVVNLHFLFKPDGPEWQPATFFLLASLVADFHFYRAYDETVKK